MRDRTFLVVSWALLALIFGVGEAAAQPFDLFVAGASPTGGSRVWRFDGATGASKGVFIERILEGAAGIDARPGATELYLASNTLGYGSIHRWDTRSGQFLGTLIEGGAGPPAYTFPGRFAFGPNGNLYVPNTRLFGNMGINGVRRYDGETGQYLGDIVAPGSGGLHSPATIEFGPDGNLYVLNRGTSTNAPIVLRFEGSTGAFLDTFVPAGSGGLNSAGDMTFGPDGNLYVSNYLGNSVLRYNGATGAFIDAFVGPNSGGLSGAASLTFAPIPEPAAWAAPIALVLVLARRR